MRTLRSLLLFAMGSVVLSPLTAQQVDVQQIIQSGTASALQQAIQKGRINAKATSSDGMTWLMWAAQSNPEADVIRVLVEAGVDVNAKHNSGGTALTMAAATNQNAEVVSALLEVGAEVNVKDEGNGMTALMNAALHNKNPQIVSVLLKAGADAKATDKFGNTVLSYAHKNPALMGTPAYRQLLAAVSVNQIVNAGTVADLQQAIKDARFDPKSKGGNGITWLMEAAQLNPNPGVISLLIQAGSDVNAKTAENDTTPLMWAAGNPNADVFSDLLKAGANVKARRRDGVTPFSLAAQYNINPVVLEILLKAGADVNTKDNSGLTPLLYAAWQNHNPAVVSTLLKAGADPTAKFGNGATVLNALQNNHDMQNTPAEQELIEDGYMTAEGSCAPDLICEWYTYSNTNYTIRLTNLADKPRHLRVFVFDTQNMVFGDETFDYELSVDSNGKYTTSQTYAMEEKASLVADRTKPSHFKYLVVDLDDESALASTQASSRMQNQNTSNNTNSGLIGAWAAQNGLYYYQFNADHTFVFANADLPQMSVRVIAYGTYTPTNSDVTLTVDKADFFGVAPAFESEYNTNSVVGSTATLNWSISGNVLTIKAPGLFFGGGGADTYSKATSPTPTSSYDPNKNFFK